jgi:hypothetical protein
MKIKRNSRKKITLNFYFRVISDLFNLYPDLLPFPLCLAAFTLVEILLIRLNIVLLCHPVIKMGFQKSELECIHRVWL